jgi:hypothetical protein
MIRYITIVSLFLFAAGLFAQEPDHKPVGQPGQKPSGLAKTAPAHKADTLKAKRILRQWTLSPDYAEEVNTPIDTVFSLFHRYRFADKYSPVNATLGNYGLPFYQINFFDRVTDPDKFLYSNYYPLMFVPDKPIFMNTQVPYTELIWTFGGKKETAEQTFRVRHSQNVNRYLNFGLIYDIVFSLGQYSFQRAEDKLANLYTSYTRDKYKLYASVGINNILALENGGITSESELGKGSTLEVPVKLGSLNKAQSTLKNRNLLLVQRFTVGKKKIVKPDSLAAKPAATGGLSGTFSHILILDNSRKGYSDDYPTSGFYDNIYISPKATFDSLSSKSMKNTIRFDFETDETRKFRLGGGFGFRNEIFRYGQIIPILDTRHNWLITMADTVKWNKSNNALVGRLFNSIGEKFRWVANGELYISGFRAGDFDLNGVITKSFDMKKGSAAWILTGGMMNRQPSFWYNQWGGNNFEWNNNMKKEFRIDFGTAFSYPARSVNVKFNYAVIKNYTDFDSTAVPSQYSGGLSVASLTLSKGLKAWKFHLDPDIILQTSSNKDILDLPEATIRAAAYFEHLFRFKKTNGKLNTQFGLDVTYYTLYHAYSYMPATGRFYRQSLSEAGNYPFVNLFINFKLQRTRFFLMFDHINYGMMGQSSGKSYCQVPDYPMNISMFRFGLAWTFYN